MMTNNTQLTATASAYVELRSNTNGVPCIMALNGSGTGVTLSGSGAISANGCAVSSNNALTAPNGTTITTPVVTYNSSAALTTTTLANIRAPAGVASVSISKRSISDPLTGSSAVASAMSHLTSVALMGNPAAPTTTAGTNLSLDYSATGKTFPSGCSGAFVSPTWTITCSNAGPFNFGGISLGGGINAVFNNTTSATYNFSGAINSSGNSLTFNGAGTYNIAQGVITGGGTTTTFPAGTYNIGPTASTCSGSGGTFSICHNGSSLMFGGPSTFVTSSGIYNSGGSTLILGSGTTNSFRIGSSSNGNGLLAGGGSNTRFGDALGVSSLFRMTGKLNISSGGGSCLRLPAAADHDVNGSFSTAGGTILGAGTYTINGYVALGANGGGDVSCGNTMVGIDGTGVTFVISATSTISSGTCSGTAFCSAAGYAHVTLTAPTSGTLRNLVVIGPTSSINTAGATFAEGSTQTSLSGMFYVPYGPFSLSGGASVGNGSGQCLEVIASQVTLTGGTAVASTCTGLGGPSIAPGTIALVQ
jgi:hypothetical protein